VTYPVLCVPPNRLPGPQRATWTPNRLRLDRLERGALWAVSAPLIPEMDRPGLAQSNRRKNRQWRYTTDRNQVCRFDILGDVATGRDPEWIAAGEAGGVPDNQSRTSRSQGRGGMSGFRDPSFNRVDRLMPEARLHTIPFVSIGGPLTGRHLESWARGGPTIGGPNESGRRVGRIQ
jgi:hypothetical protein